MQPADEPARQLAQAPEGWEMLPVPAIELSSEGQAVQANRALAEFVGQSLDDLAGTGWFAALSPDRRMALFAALAAQQDFQLEIRMLRHDGVKAWVDLRARWLPQRGSFLCVLHDQTQWHLALQDAQAQGSRFNLMADNVPVLMAYYERAEGYRCLYANRLYMTTFGRSPEQVIGKPLVEVIGEAAAREIQPQIDSMLHARRTASYVRQIVGPQSRPRWLDVSLVPHLGGDGEAIGAFVLISDITRHREAEAAVRQSEERMAKFMQASAEGIVFHQDGRITDLNEPMAALVGAPREALLGRHVFEFIAPEQLARVQSVMSRGEELTYETEVVDTRGRAIPVEFIVRTMMRGEEKLRMTIVRDIRDRQAAQARIRQLATFDALTGLYNRAAFVELLESRLAAARATGLGLMFIDLDHFKPINDRLGHVAGDAMLRTLGERLRQALPPDAFAGRYGGDEFVVLCPTATGTREVVGLAARLAGLVRETVWFDGRALRVTPTIGIALSPDHGRNADMLLRHADAAMYAGKAAGRNTVTVYEPGLEGPRGSLSAGW